MINKEAINFLQSRIDLIDKYYPDVKNYREALVIAIEALEQEPCGDCISRQALRQKLQEHHDFFANAYGGFNNLSLNDKARVDEISSCIAEVVNAPSVTPQPKMGRWIDEGFYAEGHSEHAYRCSECDEHYIGYVGEFKHCPNCGAKMEVSE